MTHKRKTVLLRWLRTLGATITANMLLVVSNPDALQAMQEDWHAFVIANLLIPTLTAMEKYLRYGAEPGEEGFAVEGDNSEVI